ncbi:DUF4157 domain-containing protein [Streptomyces sp. NPDC060020]|uniref:eCIS core domain-containing protein n=1 Tax=Streptomyces sp. NPDC060020 TaxID=3347038 RepID=UPI0036A1C8D7
MPGAPLVDPGPTPPERRRSRQGSSRRRPETAPAPRTLAALQRTVGNAAVTRMLAAGAGAGHEDAAGRPATAHEVLRSPGRPLDAPLREEMESRLGADFSDVRVHSGPLAQRSAAEIGARAHTSGRDVVPVSGTDTGQGAAGRRPRRPLRAGGRRDRRGPRWPELGPRCPDQAVPLPGQVAGGGDGRPGASDFAQREYPTVRARPGEQVGVPTH